MWNVIRGERRVLNDLQLNLEALSTDDKDREALKKFLQQPDGLFFLVVLVRAKIEN